MCPWVQPGLDSRLGMVNDVEGEDGAGCEQAGTEGQVSGSSRCHPEEPDEEGKEQEGRTQVVLGQ